MFRVVSLAIALLLPSLANAQFRDATKQYGGIGGGKAAFADYDGDGWVDLFNGRLLRNVNGKKFVHAKDAGVGGGEGIWGDYDNDGRPDLFLFVGGGALYRNKGGGKFDKVEFPKLPTVNSRGAVWLDFNNDARLDLYVGGYEIWTKAVHPDAAYLNLGKHQFKELWRSTKNFSARGVTAADLNEDGKVDVYVSNYRLQPNFLYQFTKKGKQRTLTDVAAKLGAAGKPKQVIPYTGGIRYPVSGHTIGSSVGDMDDDGHIDIFVGNFSHAAAYQDRPQFLRNKGPEGNYAFEDRSATAGLAWQESFASPTLGDYDNDGDLDLFFTTVYGGNHPVLYRNEGKWKFVNVTTPEKLAGLGATYQAAWADVDNDGDLDLCSAGRLFINESQTKNSWVSLKLVGDGKRVNKSAIGAIARIKLGDRVLTRHVESGTGEGNQNDMRLHFGLKQHKKPVTVEISWPGIKAKQVIKLTKLNTVHKISVK